MSGGDAYNVVLFGGAGVGKTSTVVQWLETKYKLLDSSYATEDTHAHEIEVDGERCVLTVFDTSTDPAHRSPNRDTFIKQADGYIVMYSIDVLQSFHEVYAFKDEVLALRPGEAPIFPVILVGNKSDLDLVREVTAKDATDLATAFGGMPILEVSSKDHNSVAAMYAAVVREVRRVKKASSKKGGAPLRNTEQCIIC